MKTDLKFIAAASRKEHIMQATTIRDTDLSRIQGGGIVWAGNSLPPAAAATAPAAHVSQRYQFISTKHVIEMMAAEGFEVHSTAVRRRRAANSAPQLGAHVVDFRHPAAAPIHGTVPRILFVNSHDGSRRAQVRVGAFRLVCANGMVTGMTLAAADARHAGDAAADLVERMRQLSRNTLPMFQQIERWTRKQLTAAQAHDFARLAAQLRWSNPHTVPTDELLAVRRPGDDAGDLWTVFNRVQEATTRLELNGRATTGRRITTKPLLEVGPNIKYNADLWALAEEFSAH